MAAGHGVEFLTAKLILRPDSWVRLEITADYASNPLIPDEEAARGALEEPVKVRVGGRWLALAELGRPQTKLHQDWTRCTPPNLPPPPPDAVHQLMTTSWEWRHVEDEVVFSVPKGKIHDVFLWEPGSRAGEASARWMLLLAGDETRGIPVLKAASGPGWWLWVFILTVACVGAWGLKLRTGRGRSTL